MLNKLNITLSTIIIFMITSLLLSVTGVMGITYDGESGLSISILSVILLIALWTTLSFAMLLCMHVFLSKHEQIENVVAKWAPLWSRKSIFIGSAILLACWLIYLIALYPGAMNWDTFYQIYQCFPENHPVINVANPSQPIDAYFHDHHPVFDTLLYGVFGVVSDYLFNNWNYGVFAFVVLQCVGFAIAMSLSCSYLEKLKTPPLIRILLFGFIALFPVFGFYNATMIKDITFTFFYIFWFILLIEVVRTKGIVLNKKRVLISLLSLCIFISITKKTGVYICAPTLLIFAFIYKGYFGKLLSCGLSALIVMFVLFPYVLFPVLNVAPGGKQEALATLFQQTARYVKVHNEAISTDDKEIIDIVLDYNTLAERYKADDTNPVKDDFNYDATTKDLVNYLIVWAKQGLNDPLLYLESTYATVSGFFSPAHIIDIHTTTGDIEHAGTEKLWNPKWLEGLRDAFTNGYHAAATLPIVGVLFYTVMYTWWIPITAFSLVIARNRQWVPVFIPVALSIAACLFSFEVYIRYSIQLLYTMPLLIGVVFAAYNINQEDGTSKNNRQSTLLHMTPLDKDA